ncbi:MAG: hypothetical protein R3C03_19485 [Pirellulaceae bacterium]
MFSIVDLVTDNMPAMELAIQFDDGWAALGKNETRPFVMDWDNDGANDLVVIQKMWRALFKPEMPTSNQGYESRFRVYWHKGAGDGTDFEMLKRAQTRGWLTDEPSKPTSPGQSHEANGMNFMFVDGSDQFFWSSGRTSTEVIMMSARR